MKIILICLQFIIANIVLLALLIKMSGYKVDFLEKEKGL